MAAVGQGASPLASIVPGAPATLRSSGSRPPRNASPRAGAGEGPPRASSHPKVAPQGQRAGSGLPTWRSSSSSSKRRNLRCSADGEGARDDSSAAPGSVPQTGQEGPEGQPAPASGEGPVAGFPSGSLQGLGLIERNLLKRKKRLASQGDPPADGQTGPASAQATTGAPAAEAAPTFAPAAAAAQDASAASPSAAAQDASAASPAAAAAAPEAATGAGTREAADRGEGRVIEAEFRDVPEGEGHTQGLDGSRDGASASEAATSAEGGTFDGIDLKAEAQAAAQAAAQATADAEANAARWREALGMPLSGFFHGPDGRPLPQGDGMDAAIFRRLSSRGIDEVLWWDAETRQKLLSSVLQGSGFVASDQGSIVVSARTATFHVRGELTDAPLRVQSNIQRKLESQALDLVAVLTPAEDTQGEGASEGGVVGAEVSFIARDILLTFTFPAPVPLLFSGASLLLCLWLSTNVSTLAIDLPLSITTIWQSAISPLCLLLTFAASLAARTAVAARYAVLPLLPAPIFLPSPAFGTFGPLWGYKGLLPNSRAALDISLASCLAGVLTSSAIVAVGAAGSRATLIGDIPSDYVLVPTDVLGHSTGLTSLAASLASLVLLPEDPSSASGLDTLTSYAPSVLESFSSPQLAIDPLVFGGLLALHASLLPLIPVGKLDGGVILTCVLGENTASLVSRAAVVVVGAAFLFGSSYNTAILWCLIMASLVLSPSGGWPLRDGLTPLGLPREALGMLAVLAGCGFLFL